MEIYNKVINALETAVNAVKDGYLYVINGIAQNPNITLWAGVGLIVLALVV